MRKYILFSIGMFFLALIVAVGVFLYINTEFTVVPQPATLTEEVSEQNPVAASVTPETTIEQPKTASDSVEVKTTDSETQVDTVPEAGTPIQDLGLNNEQLQTLELVGINPETFILTEGMLSCGEEKLGSERMAEIIAGAAPGFLEITRLLPCVTVE